MNTITEGVESTSKALSQVLGKLKNLEVVGDSLSEKKTPARFIKFPYHRVKDFVSRVEDRMTLKYHLIDKPRGTKARCVTLRGLPGRILTTIHRSTLPVNIMD